MAPSRDHAPAEPAESSHFRYVDTHCHLDDASFDPDRAEVLARASAAGVRSWIVIGFEPDRWQPAIDLAAEYPGMHHVLGTHPQSAATWNTATRDRLVSFIQDHRPRAIGEIGIDLFRSQDGLQQQQTAFDDQLSLALDHRLPVVIHMRHAERETLDVLRNRRANPPLLFHSFDGGPDLVRYILDHDAMIGVGGLATRAKSATIREHILQIPLERLVLETDAPYLVPARRKGSRNTPEAIPVIARFLADLRGASLETIARQTTTNAERFFGRLTES
jgi:TatD DNase family protein